jgi:cell wall-associated NlpC family hydrolase
MFKAGTLVTLVATALAAGCATTGAVPQPFPRPAGVPPPPTVSPPPPEPVGTTGSSAPVATGYAIAGTALALRGSPYRNGGADPTGFDCSGFVWYVFAQHGLPLPRTVSEQFRTGLSVSADALEAGDLLFFNTDGAGPTHVGMSIGGDAFVHAPSARGEVRVERMTAAYWASRYVGAKRIR